MTSRIDVYGHIGLPRFTSAEAFLALMDRHGVERTLLSTAQFCPDLMELARAVSLAPTRFQALGLPLGTDRAAVRRSVEAQLQAGFCGIRIAAAVAQDDPELLEIIGRHGKFALVVAFEPWSPHASLLVDFLDRYPRSFVIGGHFAGPGDPLLLTRDAGMARLFGHTRFVVAFTRQGLFAPAVLDPWARALVDCMGWNRILWGSEWPVALWRDESYADTMRYVDRFHPTDAQRHRFFYQNAKDLVFGATPATHIAASAQYDLMPHKVPSDIHLFPGGLHLPEPLHQRVATAYLQSPHRETMPYSAFVNELLDAGLRADASIKDR
jgi:predicted TIM-barrel fold metal-dependent hydrolase